MISYLATIDAGNAVQIMLSPPAGATRWRLLRKRTDNIAAADDAGANLVFDGKDTFITDFTALVNGTLYYYRAFYLVSNAWVASDSRSVTPECAFSDLSPDVLDVVRERLDLGFANYITSGALIHPNNHIPVLLATPAYEDCVFPFVSVHQISQGNDTRFVGEVFAPDEVFTDSDEVGSIDGELTRFQILVIAWSSNGDVRNAMRKALSAVIKSNLPVFEAAGMSLIETHFSDVDDMNTYQIPMYQATCTISCIAPTLLESTGPIVRDIDVQFINP